MVLKQQNLIILSFLFLLTMCGIDSKQSGTFVSTKNTSDTLILKEYGEYERIVVNSNYAIKDKGTWFYENNRIWFNDWVNRGETDNPFKGGDKQSVAFSFEGSFFGKIQRLYFDVDNYYYYKRIR